MRVEFDTAKDVVDAVEQLGESIVAGADVLGRSKQHTDCAEDRLRRRKCLSKVLQ